MVSEIVVDSVAEVLGHNGDNDRPLTELGLDSLLAVRLRRTLRERLGVGLEIRRFLGDVSIEGLAQLCRDHMELRADGDDGAAVRGPRESGSGVIAAQRPAALNSAAHDVSSRVRFEDLAWTESGSWKFQLSGVQGNYWVGRGADYPLGGVSTYFYNEYLLDRDEHVGEPDEAIDALETAWNSVVRRHPMLRAVVGRDGYGRIFDDLGVHEIERFDLRTESDSGAAEERLREKLSHRCVPSHRWPLHTLAALIRPGGQIVVCVGFDVLLIDFPSIRRVLAEWGEAVRSARQQHGSGVNEDRPADTGPGGGVNTFNAFAAQLAAHQVSAAEAERDLKFWRTQASELPGGPFDPELFDASQLTPPRFKRSEGRIDVETWERFGRACAAHGITSASGLCALFALALRRFGAREEFSLVTTLFNPSDVGDDFIGDSTRTALVAARPGDGVQIFNGFAREVAENFFDAVEHCAVPAARVVAERGGAASSVPEYSVVFTSALGDRAGERTDRWLGKRVFGISQTPQVLLDAIHWEEDGELILAWDHVVGGIAQEHIDGMRIAVENALRRLAAEDDAWLGSDLFADPWARTPAPLPAAAHEDAAGIHGPVMAQFAVAPGRSAVIQDGTSASSTDLLQMAEWVRSRLAGLPSAEPVLVVMDKSVEQIGVVLGIVAAGKAYIPADPAWPKARIERILARSGARVGFVDTGYGELPGEVRAIEVEPGCWSAESPLLASDEVGRTQLAYAIFTSGSTGEPKGVAIEHGQARTTIDDIGRRFGISSSDVIYGISALSFDLSVWDIFGGLGAGGTLVLPAPGAGVDPGAWIEEIAENGVTVWNSAPALAEMLVDYAEAGVEWAKTRLASLRLVMMSGDWIPVTLPGRLRALVPNVEVVSLGGATEASIWSIHHVIDAGEDLETAPSVPYGTALDGQWFRILDGVDGAPVPVGEAGELFIGGHGVARGYLGDAEQTAQRFRVHPVLGERLYRTGDEGMWLPDGKIRFLGRVDRQVKVNGFRIELGEIDAALTRIDGVRGGVCAAVKGAGGGNRLVGHIAAARGERIVEGELRAALTALLPAYMIPAAFVFHESLPVTANGKIDHKALPNPFDEQQISASAGDSGGAADPGCAEGALVAEPVEPAEPVASVEGERDSWDAFGASGKDPEFLAIVSAGTDLLLDPLSAGLDSLALVRLANLVEDRTGKRPPISELSTTPLKNILPTAASRPTLEPCAEATAPARVPEPPVDIAPLPFASVEPAEPGVEQVDVYGPVSHGVRVDIAVELGEGAVGPQLESVGKWLTGLEEGAAGHGAQLYIDTRKESTLLALSIRRDRPDPLAGGTERLRGTDLAEARDEEPAEVAQPSSESAPLTEMQIAYLVGRADPWLGVPIPPRYRTEVEVVGLDVEALRRALEELIRVHPMLSARIDDDGQQVLDERARPQFIVDESAAEATQSDRVELRRADMLRERDPQSAEPWLELRAQRIRPGGHASGDRWIVTLVLDMLFCDVRGARVIADDLFAAYRGKTLAPERASFLSWARQRARLAEDAQQVAPSGLVQNAVDAENQETRTTPVRLPVRRPRHVSFVRRTASLNGNAFSELARRCAVRRATVDAAIVTIISELLGDRTGRPSVVMTVLERPEVYRDVVGEFTSTLVVDPQSGQNLSERSRATTTQILAAVDGSLGNAGTSHGNLRVRKMLRRGARTGVLPLVYSSGLAGWDGEAATCDVLSRFGETVDSISSTPQVLCDVQSFRDSDGTLVLVVDAVDEAFPPGLLDEFLAELVSALEGAATSDHLWHEPGALEPIAPNVPRVDVSTVSAAYTSPADGFVPDHSEDAGSSPCPTTPGATRPLASAPGSRGEREYADLIYAAISDVRDVPLRAGEDRSGFFSLGMTSMDLVRLRKYLREQGIKIELAELFEFPDAHSLARHIGSRDAGAAATAAPAAPEESAPPASSAQSTASAQRPTSPHSRTVAASAASRGAIRRRRRQES